MSRGRFIKLGAALGVGAAGASILAACGGEQASSPATNQATGRVEGATEATKGGSPTVAQVEEGGAIARESDVTPGSAVEFTDEQLGQPAVLVRLENGDFKAYSAVCTHRGCTVNYKDGKLVCPCHGSVFNPAQDAAVENGPATTPLPDIPVEVQNGEVVRA
jgi:cytochrome b6-f complex iron-sulfur subunit